VGDEPVAESYRDYYREVELHWSLARGNQIIVSPLEFEAIESWYEAGVPLAVVLRAIDVFIEKKRKAKRQRSFLLTHAAGTVEKCHKEYRSLHEGDGEETNDLLGKKLEGLVRKLRKLAKDEPEAAELIAELIEALKRVEVGEIVAFEDLDKQLQSLDTRLVSWFTEQMVASELEEIRAEVNELLSREEEPELWDKLVGDAVRGQYGLPRLTLLG